MDENNNGMMTTQNSEGSNNNGEMTPQNIGGTKKNGFIMLAVAVVLALLSDYIPLPVDDVISIILAVIGGKNIFNN